MRKKSALNQLHEELRKLPGIASKTAWRLTYHIMDMGEERAQGLADSIMLARSQTKTCSICFNLSEQSICEKCSDENRDQSIICVVELPQDITAVERSKGFHGLYHVLNGVLSPLDGIGPDELRIKELLKRVANGEVTEVIVATNASIEGEATASYLARLLNPMGIKVSRIAHGLPVGGNLEYADEITLSTAIEHRRII